METENTRKHKHKFLVKSFLFFAIYAHSAGTAQFHLLNPKTPPSQSQSQTFVVSNILYNNGVSIPEKGVLHENPFLLYPKTLAFQFQNPYF